VQYSEGKKSSDDIDWRRTSVFTLFGFSYAGVCQWFVYVTIFTRLCPHAARFSNASWAEKLRDKKGQMDLVKQVMYDNFIHTPFSVFPVFYSFKTWLQSNPKDENQEPLVVRALDAYQTNCVRDNVACWSLWIPADVLVYACPIWMRLPLNHGVAFVWNIILSNLNGSNK
jgi:hypothetical protein